MWDRFVHKILHVPFRLSARDFQRPKRQRVTILMIHGIGSSMEMWRDVAKKMPPDVRVIGIDLLGFGRSPKPDWSTYDVRVQADSVVTTLFSMNVFGPVVVVGHSLGSLVAIEFARRYPLMTKSLVLVSPPLYKPEAELKRLQVNPEMILRRAYDILMKNPAAFEKVLKLVSRNGLINKGFNPENVDVPAYLATLETAIINQHSYRDILRIKRPIHIITGRFDPVILEPTIRDILRQRPNIQRNQVLGAHEISGAMARTTTKIIKTAIDEARARDNHTPTGV